MISQIGIFGTFSFSVQHIYFHFISCILFWVVGCAGAPPVPERTQHRPTPIGIKKKQKKKPKSIGETMADMQEQNRVLMEK